MTSGRNRAPANGGATERNPTLFEVACQVLNGEAKLPRAPRTPKRAKEPTFAEQFFTDTDPADTHRGALQYLEESRRLIAAALRSGIASGRRRPEPYTALALPEVRAQWEVFPDAERAFLFVVDRLRPIADTLWWMSRVDGMLMGGPLARKPDRVQAYDHCLRTAYFLQVQGASKQRLVPCLACSMFFVAKSAKAETCSAACRQRYFRYQSNMLDDRLRERERERKAKRRSRRGP